MPSTRKRVRGRSRSRGKSRNKLKVEDLGGRCAPGITISNRKWGCLPAATLNKIGENNVSTVCTPTNEHCVLDMAKQIPANERELIRKKYLRPRRPNEWKSDPDQWLDNYNIAAVMEQYQSANKWFRFVGVFPIDFSIQDPYSQGIRKCLQPEICNLDIVEEQKKGIRALGFVFNLDPHNKSGSHWVALYCWIGSDNEKQSESGLGATRKWCAYFDSYGYAPPHYIANLMRWLKSQDTRMKLMYNARRFQYGGSECGMFSLYFLICMIGNISFEQFCKESVSDEFMLGLRKVLFV
jgi:hypothetical protein